MEAYERTMCLSILAYAQEFFSIPENMQAYQSWEREKGYDTADTAGTARPAG